MIIVDTSVWIAHFRKDNEHLKTLLYENQALIHPFITGEISCGNLHNRNEILGLLAALPEARIADHYEVLALIERERLFVKGIGWIDAHLIASTLLSGSKLWSLDTRLIKAISHFGISMQAF